MIERFRGAGLVLMIALAVPADAHAQKAWQLWQSFIRRHPFDDMRTAAQTLEESLIVRAPGMQQDVLTGQYCNLTVRRISNIRSRNQRVEGYAIDAADLLAKTRIEHTAQGDAVLWAFAAGKRGVRRFASDAPDQHVDSFPVLLGPASDTAKVRARVQHFRDYLTACEWRF